MVGGGGAARANIGHPERWRDQGQWAQAPAPHGASQNPAERGRALVGRSGISGKPEPGHTDSLPPHYGRPQAAQRGVPASTHHESAHPGVQVCVLTRGPARRGDGCACLTSSSRSSSTHTVTRGRGEPETPAAGPRANEGRPGALRRTAEGRVPHPATPRKPPRHSEAHSQPPPRGE